MRLLLLFTLLVTSLIVQGQSTLLNIPDTLSGTHFQLTMHQDSVQFFPAGKISHTLGYNQYAYLGPTLIFNQGDSVEIEVINQISDTTTVHWHGLHVPARFDGGPHTPILPGHSWNPSFKILNEAATYWYHPHMHMKTAAQAIKGAAGLIIVRDSNEAKLNLPRTYGIDDIPLIVQVQEYDSLQQANPVGMRDSILLVNGSRANYGYTVHASCPAQMVRFRLLNASGERVINMGLSDNSDFFHIASDGGLLNEPFQTKRVRLAPGERAEVVCDFSGQIGDSLFWTNYGTELPMGVQGGPTMPMNSGPNMDSPLNGTDYSILKIYIDSQTVNPVSSFSTNLNSILKYDKNSANITREIRFTADSAMVMDGPFYFNDSSYHMDRIDFMIPLNNIEIWKVVNRTMVAHPFHIHDVQFQLIDRNKNTIPSPAEQGWKDVVLIPAYDSVRLIMKFTDFADPMYPYMYHCHILMHEDAGMMGQFLVLDSTMMKVQHLDDAFLSLRYYPNPVQDFVQLDNPQYEQLKGKLINLSGEVLLEFDANEAINQIDCSQLAAGVYVLKIYTNTLTKSYKLIKN